MPRDGREANALEISNLRIGYGRVQVLDGTTCTVGEGEMLAILGPNGVGKSTLLRSVSGLLGTPWLGDIRVFGHSIAGLSAHRIARLGVAHVPEGRGIFPGLSVAENLRLGTHVAGGRRRDQDAVLEWVELFPSLADRLSQKAGSLSGGQQQMLAIARALVGSPSLLLLDEPSLGLAPRIVSDVYAALGKIRRTGVSILVVEQNAAHVAALAENVMLLSLGGRLQVIEDVGDRSSLVNASYWNV